MLSIVALKYWVESSSVEQSEDPPSVPGTYIRKAGLSISVHDFLHLLQAAVVPARELEAQRPVWRDERPANQLETHEAVLNMLNITGLPQANLEASSGLYDFTSTFGKS